METRKNIALQIETLCTDALDHAGFDFQVIQKNNAQPCRYSLLMNTLGLFKIQTDAINYL